jgi:hypothetical protein
MNIHIDLYKFWAFWDGGSSMVWDSNSSNMEESNLNKREKAMGFYIDNIIFPILF